MSDELRAEEIDQIIDTMLSGGEAEEPVTAALRLLPDENFKLRLKSELQRRARMSASHALTSIREGFRTVTPYIAVVDGDGFIEFLKKVFDAQETLRHSLAPGQFHAELRIGDSMLMVGSGERLRGHERLIALHAYVDDCDGTYARALAAGATSLGEPADRPYGERSGFVADAFGNVWYIAARAPGNSAPESAGTLLPYLHPQKARAYIAFLEQALGAEQMGVYEQDGRVMHAAVRIGTSVVEMGEPDKPMGFTSALFMYVNDVDAVFARALAAGAKAVSPPTDQSYGHREAAFEDPVGNIWYPAAPI